MESLLEVGQIVNSYGIKGFLKVVPLVDNNEQFKAFEDGGAFDVKGTEPKEVEKAVDIMSDVIDVEGTIIEETVNE